MVIDVGVVVWLGELTLIQPADGVIVPIFRAVASSLARSCTPWDRLPPELRRRYGAFAWSTGGADTKRVTPICVTPAEDVIVTVPL
jgi:hypothetical protein